MAAGFIERGIVAPAFSSALVRYQKSGPGCCFDGTETVFPKRRCAVKERRHRGLADARIRAAK